MNRLTWLASYPKSGSTWVRAFLAAYQSFEPGLAEFDLTQVPHCSTSDSRATLFAEIAGKPFESLSEGEIDALRGQVQRRLASSTDSTRVVKTHNVRAMRGGFPLIDRTVTRRAVYVVRNPLDIIDSMADHAALAIDGAIALLGDRRHQMGGKDGTVRQYIDSWSEHVTSWTQHPAFPILVLRYEDMLNDTSQAFSHLLKFLEWEIEPVRLAWAIEQTRFDSLQQKEAANGFAEVSCVAKSGVFFRHGQHCRWPSVLTKVQAERVIQDHAAAMRLIGYEVPDLDQIYSQLGDSGEAVSLSKAVPSVALVTHEAKLASVRSTPKEKVKQLFVPPEWKRWIAENLLLGVKPDELVRVLIEKGYPESLCRLEVDVADSHPYMNAARQVMQRK